MALQVNRTMLVQIHWKTFEKLVQLEKVHLDKWVFFLNWFFAKNDFVSHLNEKVFEGVWQGTTRIAMKRLSDPTHATAFEKEAALLRDLRHPNVVMFLGLVNIVMFCVSFYFSCKSYLFSFWNQYFNIVLWWSWRNVDCDRIFGSWFFENNASKARCKSHFICIVVDGKRCRCWNEIFGR